MQQTEQQLKQTMSAIGAALGDNFEAARQSAQLSMKMYRHLLGGMPALNGVVGADDIPQITAGSLVLNGNLSYLEQIQAVIGADPAVMVLHRGNFVRVATLLKDKEGKSQIGVPLANEGPEAKALAAGETYFGMVNRSGRFYMSIFEPVKDGSGKVVGAISVRIGLDKMLDRMKKSVGSLKIGETGYAYVMIPGKEPAETVMLVHPALAGKQVGEVNNPLLNKVVGDLVKMGDGILYYDWVDGKTGREGSKVAAVATIPSAGWVVGAGSWSDEFTAPALGMRNILIIAALLGAILTVVLVSWVASRGLLPITRLVDAVERMGQGNLAAVFKFDAHSRNEVDRLAQALETMRQGVGNVISRIGDTSRSLNTAAQQMEDNAGQVFDGSRVQSESAAALASEVQQLSVSIAQVNEGASQAESLSRAAREGAQQGSGRASQVTGEITEVEGEIAETAHVVSQLGNRTSDISRVVDLIKDIAEQTNLLALNAAIEAARAGESGRGFAVVADEVRKLAERTTVSASEIGTAIGAVQSESGDVVTRIEQLVQRMQQVVKAVELAGQGLTEIETQSSQALNAVTVIASGTREQNEASQSIAGGVEDMAKLSERNRSVSEQSREAAVNLGRLAVELDGMVARFTLS